MTTRASNALALARQQLGLRTPSLALVPQRSDAVGVGAAAAPLTINPALLRAPISIASMHPAVAAAMVAPAQRPAISIADRSEWMKKYAAISIPVNSDEDEPDGILPGASLAMKPSSQVTVWITDFTIDTDEPCDFIITQLRISRVDLIGGQGGIPASRFKQNSRRPPINVEVLSGGSFIALTAKNINKTQTLSLYGSFDGLDMNMPLAASM